jgi:hypothetical protein
MGRVHNLPEREKAIKVNEKMKGAILILHLHHRFAWLVVKVVHRTYMGPRYLIQWPLRNSIKSCLNIIVRGEHVKKRGFPNLLQPESEFTTDC